MLKRLPSILLAIIFISLIVFLYRFTPGYRFSRLVELSGAAFERVCIFDSLISSLLNFLATPYHYLKLKSYLNGTFVGDMAFLITQIVQFLLLYRLITKPTRIISFPLKLFYSFTKNIFQNIILSVSVIALPLIFTYPILYYQNNYLYLSSYFWPLLFLFILLAAITIIVEQIEHFKKLSEERAEKEDTLYLKSDRADIKLEKNANNYTYVERLYSIIAKLDSNRHFYSIALNGSWGTGKTTILNNLREELESNSYEVVWLNVWQLKNTNNLIGEIERAILKFCKEALYFVPHEFFSYFELLNKIHSNKALEKTVSTALNWMKKQTFEESMRVTKELIERALKAANKKKLIFIFDDIDRILDKEESVILLKTIRYITNFDNSIAISGLDMEVVSRVIKKDLPLLNSSFLNKIFNLVVEIFSKNEQYELTVYLKNGWESIKRDILKEELQLDDEEFASLDELIKSGKLYDIFHNYREIKLSLNDFVGCLTMMHSLAKRAEGKVSDNINIQDIFIMSILKIITGDFYKSFISDMKKGLYKLEDTLSFTNIIEKYLNEKLLIQHYSSTQNIIFKNDSDYRIYSIFKLLGFEISITENAVSIKWSGFIKRMYIGSIIAPKVFLYYITPTMRRYQFSIREMTSHIENLTNLEEKKENDYHAEIERAIIDTIENKKKSLNIGFTNFEYLGIIKDYLDKYYSLLPANKLEFELKESHETLISKILYYVIFDLNSYLTNASGELIQDFFNMLIKQKGITVYSSEFIIPKLLLLINNNKLLPHVVEPLFKAYSLYQPDQLEITTNKWIKEMKEAFKYNDGLKLTILLYFYATGAAKDKSGNYQNYIKTIYKEVKSLNIAEEIEDREIGSTIDQRLLELYKYSLEKFIFPDLLKIENFLETLYGEITFFLDYFKSGPNSSRGNYLLCQKEIALRLLNNIYERFDSKTDKEFNEGRLLDYQGKLISHLNQLFDELAEGYKNGDFDISEEDFIKEAKEYLKYRGLTKTSYKAIIWDLNMEYGKLKEKLEALDTPKFKGPIIPVGTPPSEEEE